MKKLAVFVTLAFIMALGAAATQAFAGPPPLAAKGTHGPRDTKQAPSGTAKAPVHTPGAQATAQAGLHGKPRLLRGTVAAVDASSLTLTLPDGSSATVQLTPETKIRVPGPKSAGDTLAVGMHAMAMAFDQGGSLVARMVIAIPGRPIRVHRVGAVTAYAPGSSITIQAKDGSSYTFALTPETKILPQDRAGQLAVGSLVTIIAPRTPSSTDWTAKGIVVHPSS